MVRTHIVQTECVLAAGGRTRALVQIVASSRQLCLADVSQLAAAEVASFRVGAVRVGAACVRALVDVLAGDLWVPGESRRALAIEASGRVDACGSRAAGKVRVQALVHVHAAVVSTAR